MSEPLLKVESVSKRYCRDLRKSLLYGVEDIGRECLALPPRNGLRNGEFWANKDISFELQRGECLGLIGSNGAGKSTLLKLIAGLTKPDEGRITVNGRIGALIELGAGFNPLLTGRENIYINGAVLGMGKKEIDRKLDAILDFADIGEFIESSVQSYSSGMKVRLGFAVAVHLEPDILLIDEVLAVGDMSFRIKCINKIFDLLPNCGIIFVSHSLKLFSRITNRALRLNHGVAEKCIDTKTALKKYLSDLEPKEKQTLSNQITNGNGKEIEFTFHPDQNLFELNLLTKPPEPLVANIVFELNTEPCLQLRSAPLLGPEIWQIKLPEFHVREALTYSLTLVGQQTGKVHFKVQNSGTIKPDGETPFAPILFAWTKVARANKL